MESRYFYVAIPFPAALLEMPNLMESYSNYGYFLHSCNEDGKCTGDCWVLNTFILNMHTKCSESEIDLVNTSQ